MQSRFDQRFQSRISGSQPRRSLGVRSESPPSRVAEAQPKVRLVVNGYEDTHYNICQMGEKYYGLHQQEGPFNIGKIESGRTERPVYIASSLDEVTALIKAAGPTSS